MGQFINFSFYDNWGVCPYFEGLDRNKNSKFSILFYVLSAHKISLQSDNFYFLTPTLKNKYRHSSCRKKLHQNKLKKIFWRPCYIRVHTEHKQTHRQAHGPTDRQILNFLDINFYFYFY